MVRLGYLLCGLGGRVSNSLITVFNILVLITGFNSSSLVFAAGGNDCTTDQNGNQICLPGGVDPGALTGGGATTPGAGGISPETTGAINNGLNQGTNANGGGGLPPAQTAQIPPNMGMPQMQTPPPLQSPNVGGTTNGVPNTAAQNLQPNTNTQQAATAQGANPNSPTNGVQQVGLDQGQPVEPKDLQQNINPKTTTEPKDNPVDKAKQQIRDDLKHNTNAKKQTTQPENKTQQKQNDNTSPNPICLFVNQNANPTAVGRGSLNIPGEAHANYPFDLGNHVDSPTGGYGIPGDMFNGLPAPDGMIADIERDLGQEPPKIQKDKGLTLYPTKPDGSIDKTRKPIPPVTKKDKNGKNIPNGDGKDGRSDDTVTPSINDPVFAEAKKAGADRLVPAGTISDGHGGTYVLLTAVTNQGLMPKKSVLYHLKINKNSNKKLPDVAHWVPVNSDLPIGVNQMSELTGYVDKSTGKIELISADLHRKSGLIRWEIPLNHPNNPDKDLGNNSNWKWVDLEGNGHTLTEKPLDTTASLPFASLDIAEPELKKLGDGTIALLFGSSGSLFAKTVNNINDIGSAPAKSIAIPNLSSLQVYAPIITDIKNSTARRIIMIYSIWNAGAYGIIKGVLNC